MSPVPWVPEVFLARFPVSVMSLLCPARKTCFFLRLRRSCLRPSSEQSSYNARKNLWYPGYVPRGEIYETPAQLVDLYYVLEKINLVSLYYTVSNLSRVVTAVCVRVVMEHTITVGLLFSWIIKMEWKMPRLEGIIIFWMKLPLI